MTNMCKTCLIEENVFVRAGLKFLLEESGYAPIMELPSIAELKSGIDLQEYGLIIFGAENLSAAQIKTSVEIIKSKFLHTHVLILASDLNMNLIRESFLAGADGIILKEISPEVFLHSLDLIILGEKIFPSAMIDLLLSNKTPEELKTNSSPHNDTSLSNRENDIMTYLQKGDSNKVIARQLGITEETVKVHVKAILRKLGLKNRTQAAIWAVNNQSSAILENA